MPEYFQKEEFPSEMKNIRGSCVDCYGILTLFEEDFINKTRILVCEQCGLLHLYKKTLLSGWKLVKVRKKANTSE
jgi:hypothetical protein